MKEQKSDLSDCIEQALIEQCLSRSLDDKNDFKEVMEVINSTVDQWINNRCPGCR